MKLYLRSLKRHGWNVYEPEKTIHVRFTESKTAFIAGADWCVVKPTKEQERKDGKET